MTLILTSTGIAFDLMQPKVHNVNFDIDIAESLAKLPRFNGHIRSGPYSIAQHCVLGADMLFYQTRSLDLAAYYLLSNAYKAYAGDIHAPVARALSSHTGFSVASSEILKRLGLQTAQKEARNSFLVGLQSLKSTLDKTIFEAAELSFPIDKAYSEKIHEMEQQLFVTEQQLLLTANIQGHKPEKTHQPPLPIGSRLTVWQWQEAADEYRSRLRKYVQKFHKNSDEYIYA